VRVLVPELSCFEHQQNLKTMKKIVWVYGTIAGLIMGAMFFITAPFWKNGSINFDNGMWVGYTTMVVALSLVFFGIKNYRDEHKKGMITFGHAFKVGILISLIASLLYALSWEVAFKTVSKGFSEEMSKYYVAQIKNKPMGDAEKKKEVEDMEQMMTSYNDNTMFRFGLTLLEVFPVGLLVTLISAGLLRKKEFLEESN
jgi:hypothetical protein